MRLHISLPDELVEEIDEIAGKRGRSALIRKAIVRELEDARAWERFERAAGSVPDFASHLPKDWVREGRRRSTERSNERIREALARHDRPG